MKRTPPSGTALVTGASSGIGYHYARRLAERGHSLLLVSNEEQKIRETAAALSQEFGIDARPLYMDLARGEAAAELYAYCRDNGIEIEILINNAGIFFFNDLGGVREELIPKMIALHIQTPSLLCRYFGEAMKRRGGGYILNMSSLSAWTPCPGISVYSASKSYLKNLSYAIREELYDYGVGVTVVCPGAVATDLYNLSPRLQRLALRLGVMMTPERLTRKAIRALLARRRRIVPGFINRIFLGLVPLLPPPLIRLIKRKAKFYRYGN